MCSERIAVKFGGSSVADGTQIEKVAAILKADARRRIVVVSAPGKRNQTEAKLTDLLYLCQETAAIGTSIAEPFRLIRQRFGEIIDYLQADQAILAEIDELQEAFLSGCSGDFAASRGEYFSARIIADFLGGEFIDPADHITIRANGSISEESYESLAGRFADHTKLYVMAGFYGQDRNGEIKTFSRGGSDISGAIAARAASAVLYENWTDTSGILMADPRLIDNPRPINEISFREIREMAYMGASVFHDEAIQPVRETGIPIRIANTNRPNDPGTLITASLSEETVNSTEVAGIAGKQDFTMISLEKSLMNKEIGFVYRLLGLLQAHNISFEHCPSSIDSVSIIIENDKLKGLDDILVDDIRTQLAPDSIVVEKDLALVAVVGEGMVSTVGIAGKIFAALGTAGINVRVINQGASELNIIIGIAGSDYKRTVRTLYDVFAKN